MTILKNKRRTVAPKRALNCVLTSFVVVGFSSAALGNPLGGTIVEGSATINQVSPTQVDVVSTTDRAIINWTSFSIGSGELTRFQMNSSDSAVLNRVTGLTASQIDGMLTSNGRVYLINPNGVLIGAGGMVQTQSFIASTRDITDEDFLDGGELTFLGTGSSEVHNLGTIQASDGDVALIGNRVVNTGTGSISAPQGVIALAAGDEVMLAAPGSSRLLVRVAGVTDTQAAQIHHTGVLNAAQAELQAVGGNLYALAVNAAGVINATGVQNRDGRIYLTGDGARIDVTGTLTARNSDGAGGSIQIDSGVDYASEVRITGTLDASSASTGGGINIDSSRIELHDGAHLLVSGGSGNAGGVFLGSEENTNQLIVAEGASIAANSLSGDAGNIDLSAAGVYFHGQLQARGEASQAQFNIYSGEAVEYTGLADLRAYGDQARFGSVNIESAYANLRIAPTDGIVSVLDSGALATQLNYGNVSIAANGSGRYIDLFAPLSWQSATRLTLQADDTVDINQSIDASNGSLHLTSRNAGVSDLEPATIVVRDLWLSAAENVDFSNRIVAQNVTLYDIGGRTWLTNEQNQLGSITFMRDLRAQSGEVHLVDSAGGLSLTTSNVGGSAYSTDGNFRVRTSGDLTLAPAFQTQVGGDVTLVAAGGVLRNQSTAGADVFGTSSTGLERTRVYASGAGENGGLQGAAQYNVSYSMEHESAASTGFYYSGSAPQDPGPVDPVDPVDPPPVPEPPPLPPSQIIQTALDGNSFEQLNRPAADNIARNNPTPQSRETPASDPNSASLTSVLLDRMEELARLNGIDGPTTKRPKDADEEQTERQLPPPLVDQLDDFVARLTALLEQLQSSGAGGPTPKDLSQKFGSLSLEQQQQLLASPQLLQQQLSIIMAQIAMDRRNEARDARGKEMSKQIDQLQQAAEQMRDAASQRLMAAIIAGITQIAGGTLTLPTNYGPGGGLKQPATPALPTPLPIVPPPVPQSPTKNVPVTSPGSGTFGGPAAQLPPPPKPIIIPVAPPIPAAVQAQMDAARTKFQDR